MKPLVCLQSSFQGLFHCHSALDVASVQVFFHCRRNVVGNDCCYDVEEAAV